MTQRARNLGTCIAWLLLTGAFAACVKTHTLTETDSTTNWLKSCETSAECGDLACVCGVCNVSCNGDQACATLDPKAQCITQPASDDSSVCERSCMLVCSASADCPAGRACRSGQCVDALAVVGSGDAGTGTLAISSAVRLSSATDGFSQIAVGGRHSCGLLGDGSVQCWGSDYYLAVSGAPASAAAHFTQLASGSVHSCGLRGDGSLSCWGASGFDMGQVEGPNADHSTNFARIAAGESATCALRKDGSLKCWGNDAEGAISGANGDGHSDFVDVAIGVYHICGLRTDGSLKCWGRDLDGCVSLPNADGGNDFVQVAAGGGHTCALRRDGSLICWGTMEWNREVSGPNGSTSKDFVQLMAAAYQTCGLHADHHITCWGDDADSQVTGANMNGDADFAQLSGSIEVDGNFLCGLHADGTVSCWGNNTKEQLSIPKAFAR